MSSPGRNCPLHYRYSPTVFAREPHLRAYTVYVVGGLYGNIQALDAIEAMAAEERSAVALVFNGDFNWFDVADEAFATVNDRVLQHAALRGNVETELAGDSEDAGCGCAYPQSVTDEFVARSNRILSRLRETSRRFPDRRARLGALPMHVVAAVGPLRLGIVHGDAESLAGWGFAAEALDDPSRRRWIEQCFAAAQVDLFASSHTCLPACRAFSFGGHEAAVINNGAAGMPNFRGPRYGVITRIGVTPPPHPSLYGLRLRGAHVDALAVAYDHAAWCETFLHQWPPGSPACESYYRRIVDGPDYTLAQAHPSGVAGHAGSRPHFSPA